MDTLEIEMVGVGMTCVSTILASVDMAWKLHRKKDEKDNIMVIPKPVGGFSYEDDEKANSTNMLVKVKKMIPRIRKNGI